MNYQLLDTPIGKLRLVSLNQKVAKIEFDGQHRISSDDVFACDPVLEETASQLGEYFAGRRKLFDLPLDPAGTEFQQQVWSSLLTIPYGELRSYSDIANTIKRPRAVRAVGAANGRNPIPIIVPCHRVIGRNGSLTGFAGGLELKKQLLELEGALQN